MVHRTKVLQHCSWSVESLRGSDLCHLTCFFQKWKKTQQPQKTCLSRRWCTSQPHILTSCCSSCSAAASLYQELSMESSSISLQTSTNSRSRRYALHLWSHLCITYSLRMAEKGCQVHPDLLCSTCTFMQNAQSDLQQSKVLIFDESKITIDWSPGLEISPYWQCTPRSEKSAPSTSWASFTSPKKFHRHRPEACFQSPCPQWCMSLEIKLKVV